MLSLRQGDIVFAYFPFEEDKSILKKRPCFVLALDDCNSRFLAAKITTTKINRYWAFRLSAGKSDLASGSLRSDSWINLCRREWIPFNDYIFSIGTIKNNILDFIIRKITSGER